MSGQIIEETPQKPNTHFKKYIGHLLRLFLFLSVAVALFYFDVVDFHYVLRLDEHIGAILTSLLLLGVAVALSVQRWRMLLAIKGITIQYVDLWHINYLSLFANNFLPGGAGGDLVRAYLLVRYAKGAVVKNVVAVGMDRIIGLLALLTIFIGIFLYRHSATAWNTPLFNFSLAIAVLTYLGIVLGILLLIFRRNIGLSYVLDKLLATNIKFISHLIDIISSYRSNGKTLLLCFLMSLVMQGLTLVIIAIIAVSLKLGSVTAGDYALAGAAALVASAVPLTPGGIGVAEGVFDQVCKLLVSDAIGSFGTAYFVFRTVGLLFSLPAIFSYTSVMKKHKVENAPTPGSRDA